MRAQGPEADVLEAVIAFANGDSSKAVSPQVIASGEALSKHVDEDVGIAELDRAYLLVLFFIANGDPELHVVLHQLNDILLNRFRQTGDRRELDASLNAGKAALASLPPEHPMLHSIAAHLGTSIVTRYATDRNFQDLELAIQVSGRVVAADRAAHREQSPELDVLMGVLAEARNSPHDESESDIVMDGIRLVLTVVDGPSRNGMLADFGVKLQNRYKRTGSRQDLDESIDVLREAAVSVPPDHPQASSPWFFLSSALLSRYLLTGDMADLEESLAASRRSLQYSDPASEAHPTDLNQVALALRCRYERTGDDADLGEGIELGQRAVALMGPGHPDRGIALQTLGVALKERYDRTGRLDDLEAAVTALRHALDTVDATRNRALCLSSLAVALGERFRLIGAGVDIDDAVEAVREARAITPRESQLYVPCTSQLGSALLRRYERTHDRADLDEAIECDREALALTPEWHRDHAGYLSDLCVVLLHRSAWSASLDDLAEAIAAAKQGLELLPEDHPDRGLFLHNLGSATWARFTITGDFADADAAIATSHESLERTPPDSPDHARYLLGLQILHETRYERGGDIADLDAIIAIARQALPSDGTDGVTAMALAQAGASAAMTRRRLSPSSEDLEHALDCYRQALDALPLLSMRGLDESDVRIRLDENAASLGRDAAACAIEAGKPELAIRHAEAGRGIVWGRLLDLRADMSGLHASHPDLAEELEELRVALAAEPSPAEDAAFTSPMSDHSFQRVKTGRRFDELIARVRDLPPTTAFPHPQRFLEPYSAEDLAQRIGDGAAVLVNVSVWRCDAIIVTGEDTQVLPLSFTAEEAEDVASRYLAALNRGDRFGLETTTRMVAQWMWDAFAGPILDRIDRLRGAGGAPHRIWWCPTGPLTLLPVHAAGHHEPGGTETVIDRAVSSYTPTLRALAHARRRTPHSGPPSGLAVAIAKTPRPTGGPAPAYSDLPGTRLELRTLRHLFGEHAITALEDAEATREAVIAGLGSRPWVHIACHGMQDLRNPANGGLVPYDWTTEGLIRIGDLAAVADGDRDLAFLSACQTATGGVVNLDEAVHLAAAMRHAGWLHVIGTLWTIDDSVAVTVAEHFYRNLIRGGRFDPSGSAYALHRAVRELRERDPARLSHWARFVHFGP